MSKITVKITNPAENGRNYGREKELVGVYSLIAKKNRAMAEAVTIRVYMGRSRSATTIYATAWIRGNGDDKTFISGSGSAGGGGYCKESSAIASAIHDSGVELYGNPYTEDASRERLYFGGTGLSRLHDILDAIAKKQGFNVNGSILIKHW